MAIEATIKSGDADVQSSTAKSTTRSENQDTSTEVVFGRMPPRTCNRTPGFSARYHKSIAIVSGASVNRAGVLGRRRLLTTMLSHDITISGPEQPTNQSGPTQNDLLSLLHYTTLHYTTLKEAMIAYSNNDSSYHLIAERGCFGGGVDV